LMGVAAAHPVHELAQGGGLVAAGLERAHELEAAVGGGGHEARLRRAHGAHLQDLARNVGASPSLYVRVESALLREAGMDTSAVTVIDAQADVEGTRSEER